MKIFSFHQQAQKVIFISVLSMLLLLVLPHIAFAAEADALQALADSSGLAQTSLPILIAKIIRAVLGVLGIILVVLVVTAGFKYMTAGGDPKKVEDAKKILKNAVIGLVIILSSYSIASWILGKLLTAANGPGSIISIAKKYSEPLAGSLGAGIIEAYYPMRNATDVPRNTKIFVTFKEEMKPESIIDGYVSPCTYQVADPQTTPLCKTNLKKDAVSIFETAKGESSQLASDKVVVTVSDDKKTFVFKPVAYIGSPTKDTSYTVALKPKIQKADGSDAFKGAYAAGEAWSFVVSTNIDLTPPKIVSVIPSPISLLPVGQKAGLFDRNISVEITFNEPMDPLATSGVFEANGGINKNFKHIVVSDGTKDANGLYIPVTNGSYQLSNGYKTVSFITTDACGTDPCGGTIFCLPGGKDLTVVARAASIDAANVPQGILTGVSYDGLVDATGNSLDGNGDSKACGSATDKVECDGTALTDDYVWSFSTSNTTNLESPKIVTITPDIGQGSISPSDPLYIMFDGLLSASSINSTNVSLVADPYYSLWYSIKKEDVPEAPQQAKRSVIKIDHPEFISNADGGSRYYPILSEGIKSAYQICMYPAIGKSESSAACAGTNPKTPYCCNGSPSDVACKNSSGDPLVPVKKN